jgi:hypothetical protein
MPRLKPIYVTKPTVVPQRCTRCGETKAADLFHRDPSMLSGLRTRCKECELAAQRERYARVGKKRTRTREQRQAEKRRAAERAGKVYTPREIA